MQNLPPAHTDWCQVNSGGFPSGAPIRVIVQFVVQASCLHLHAGKRAPQRARSVCGAGILPASARWEACTTKSTLGKTCTQTETRVGCPLIQLSVWAPDGAGPQGRRHVAHGPKKPNLSPVGVMSCSPRPQRGLPSLEWSREAFSHSCLCAASKCNTFSAGKGARATVARSNAVFSAACSRTLNMSGAQRPPTQMLTVNC